MEMFSTVLVVCLLSQVSQPLYDFTVALHHAELILREQEVAFGAQIFVSADEIYSVHI